VFGFFSSRSIKNNHNSWPNYKPHKAPTRGLAFAFLLPSSSSSLVFGLFLVLKLLWAVAGFISLSSFYTPQ
jgi:hypothetical protein